MKALILGAGYGTRLSPYTDIIPKPLFRINGRPVIDRTIRQLAEAGCSSIAINTHHLHYMIESFIYENSYPLPVETIFEPEILNTGGAMRNAVTRLGNTPFFVVNGDIVTEIDYKEVYSFHLSHDDPVTLVLHDYPEFNNVSVDSSGMVKGFHLGNCPLKKLAFTGIQVLDPSVIEEIPENESYSSISLYNKLIAAGKGVSAFICRNVYWADIGTPEKYAEACIALEAHLAFGEKKQIKPSIYRLKGDGSDRKWYRLKWEDKSVILGDHGISPEPAGKNEARSFVEIGRHLEKAGIPVPKILHANILAGHVYVEDLGDLDLAATVKNTGSEAVIAEIYRGILKDLAALSVDGGRDFDPAMTWQTPEYDKNLIIQKECNYFIDSFVNTCTPFKTDPAAFSEEFSELAERTLANGLTGFMHRDCQSRNIMMTEKGGVFIDFQGGRSGPVQYDLASLMIDPYTGLSESLQEDLVLFFIKELQALKPFDTAGFLKGYEYLKITRNLQMLGAFGFLSGVKGKDGFKQFIPVALKSLKKNIRKTESGMFTKLKKLIEDI